MRHTAAPRRERSFSMSLLSRSTESFLVLPLVLSVASACSSSESNDGANPEGAAGSGGAQFGPPGGGGVASPYPGSGGVLPPPPPTCGDGAIQAPESCDGANLNQQTCSSATLGALPDGALGCTTSCTFDTRGCTGAGDPGGTGGAPGIGGSDGAGGDPGGGGAPSSGGSDGAGGSTPISNGESCTGFTLPAATDYGARGPYAVTIVKNTGPDGQYTMFRPASLGGGGFLHPPLSWGNGITTTPDFYVELLSTFASHGFVVIASISSNVTAALMTSGLDWLLAQNAAAGDFQGKLATKCAATVGYSLGGGAAVTSGSHAAVVTTVSFHGLQGSAEKLHGPLLLFTSTADGFVTKASYVQPCYNRSTVVPTIMATLQVNAPADFAGHLYPLGGAGDERAPAVAWLRYWVYGDLDAKSWFYGADCKLCKTPWTDIQRKNAQW
jgi:hypothetical protein